MKKIAGGRFSELLGEAIRPGQTLEVMTPMGRFGVAPEPEAVRTYVGLACGSGITPILSIVKSALTREPRSRFFLFYGNRTSASIIFRETLEDLKDRFVERLSVFHILSREAQDVPILNGRLDAEKIALLLRAVVPASEVDHVFVCGPSGMLEDAEAALKTLGLRDEQIHFERFTPAEGGAGRPGAAADHRRRDPEGGRRDHPRRRAPFLPGRGRRGDRRCGAARRARPALFLPGRHVLHLSGEDRRGRGRDDPELLARALGDRGRLRADLPVAAEDRAGGGRLRPFLKHDPEKRASYAIATISASEAPACTTSPTRLPVSAWATGET